MAYFYTPAQCVLLFLVLAGNSVRFQISRSYTLITQVARSSALFIKTIYTLEYKVLCSFIIYMYKVTAERQQRQKGTISSTIPFPFLFLTGLAHTLHLPPSTSLPLPPSTSHRMSSPMWGLYPGNSAWYGAFLLSTYSSDSGKLSFFKVTTEKLYHSLPHWMVFM